MQGIFGAIGSILIYFLICASAALTARLLLTINDELFRKILHMILLGSLFVWTVTFPNWWSAALSAVIFAILVYPILWFAEGFQGYSKLVTERKSGELKSSLIMVFFMFAAVLSVCWGYLGDKMLALASIYAWGFGDAAAALVGKRFGKHKFGGKQFVKTTAEANPKDEQTSAKEKWLQAVKKKSVEGTAAMFVVSFASVLFILSLRGGLSEMALVLISAVVASFSAIVELFTPNGLDTITCPFTAMAVLLPLVHLFGGV